MTKRIDSDALGVLNKALGLTGAGSPVTDLADGVVDQSLDIVPIARRGRTLGQSEGLFTAIISNIHAGAGTLTTLVDPYAPGATIAIAPFPAIVPAQFDVWLLSCTLRRESGVATVNASLSFQPGARNQGWGVTDMGVAVVQQDPQAIAGWDTLISTNTVFGKQAGISGPLMVTNMRLSRGTAAFPGMLRFVSVAAGGAGTFNCSLNFGLFPVSLGQDGVV